MREQSPENRLRAHELLERLTGWEDLSELVAVYESKDKIGKFLLMHTNINPPVRQGVERHRERQMYVAAQQSIQKAKQSAAQNEAKLILP